MAWRSAFRALAHGLPDTDEWQANSGERSRGAEWKSARTFCLLIAALFFLKFAAFALFITPLWNTPDESGHYSFVEDLSHGHYPVLGEARMSRDVVDSWIKPGAHQGYNWIAQHPPLFYALDAPIVMATRALGASFDTQVRCARLLSSFFAALTLLGLYALLAEATERPLLGMAGAIFIGSTPMFTQLGSGVTHDTLIACTAAWGAYWYLRWVRSGEFPYALLCAFIIGLGCITKVTMLALAVPMFFVMAFRFIRTRGPLPTSSMVRQLGTLWLVMFALVATWMVYNLIHFHKPLPDASLLHGYPSRPNTEGFFNYMWRFPIWQNVLLNFVALIGWTGTLHGTIALAQADGLAARLFVGAILFSSLAAILGRLCETRRDFLMWAPLTTAVVITVTTCSILPKHDFASLTCVILFIAILWAPVSSILWPRKDATATWMLLTSSIFVLFFSVLYYCEVWEVYRHLSMVKALHGRYFYVVMPFLALLLLWPLRRGWLPKAALCLAVAAMVAADGFFLHYAYKLYGVL